MSNVVIKVENLSKQYRLGEIGTGSLAHDINRWWYSVRGKEDPYLKIGETNDRTKAGNSDYVWSLKDVDFSINQGDAVGIIGRNGAGKSTLLKVLSQVTAPTTGTVKVKGRIASLLEVGTGFHPDLSGRDNIFLNGAILGMRKAEIKRKFDEIVDFAGVERYIDTPVKRYSSGMYVRLAFAVAAHLESEILIVDEVLAVGDAEFQKKCLGKMGDVSKGEGRTVLFVSHNMGSIAQLCNKGIYMKFGTIDSTGPLNQVLNNYVAGNSQESSYVNTLDKEASHFSSVFFTRNASKIDSATYLFSEDINLNMAIKFKSATEGLTASIIVKDIYDTPVFSSHHELSPEMQAKGQATLQVTVPAKTLLAGDYKVQPLLHVPNVKFVDKVDTDLNFSIEDSGSDFSQYYNANLGKIVLPIGWKNLV